MPKHSWLAVILLLAACSSSKPATAPSTITSAPPASTTTTVPPPKSAVKTGESEINVLWRQGVARIPGGWVFSGTRTLARTDDKFVVQQTLINAMPKSLADQGYNHIGDVDVVGDYIYAPLEQPNYDLGHQATARFRVDTLAFVDVVTVKQHENSFVTVDPATMIAYSFDHFGGAAFLRYDIAAGWKPLAPLKMSQFVDKVQGADIADGALWLSTNDDHRGIYRVDLATGATNYLASMGKNAGDGTEGEGIDATDLPTGLLHTVFIAGFIAPVLFQHFAPSPDEPTPAK